MEVELEVINKELLRKLCDYSGLQISALEEEKYLSDLNGILEMLKDLADAEIPLSAGSSSRAVLRTDEEKAGLEHGWIDVNAECEKDYVCSGEVWDKEK